MIKSTDLRIGNWVSIPECAIIVPITGICTEKYRVDNTNVDLDDADIWFEPSSFEPIPLTPEVLEKAGFILMNKVTQRFKKYINETDSECICLELSEVGNNKPYRVMYDYNAGTYLKQKVLYLHDLQNLYRYLTGTELTLNICTATTQNDTL